MSQKFIDQALDRNNDFRELSKRMNIIMERYLDYRGYTVETPELFVNWLRGNDSVYIRYLDSEEELRIDIEKQFGQSDRDPRRFMRLECEEVTLSFSLVRRANGFVCRTAYYPAVVFHTHGDDVADYLCYFAELQEEGKIRMDIISQGVTNLNDEHLKEHLGIAKEG
jgi:hypothetical protein|nr:MAG TPA: hypothetical protein [Caudoviricetes sp.]